MNKTSSMIHKTFIIVYVLFVCTMILLFFLSLFGLIYFGVELSNQVTRIGLVIGVIISVPVFVIANRMMSEAALTRFVQFTIIILLLGVLAFLLSDFSTQAKLG